VEEGIKKAIPIIKDADRTVLPTNHNNQLDHQATYEIAIGSAKEFNLTNLEFFVYFIASRGKFQEDSKDNQFQYTINENKAFILGEWLKIYHFQAKMKWTWKMYSSYLKIARAWTYAIFTFDDTGKYYNF
jgi:hypothetical protein